MFQSFTNFKKFSKITTVAQIISVLFITVALCGETTWNAFSVAHGMLLTETHKVCNVFRANMFCWNRYTKSQRDRTKPLYIKQRSFSFSVLCFLVFFLQHKVNTVFLVGNIRHEIVLIFFFFFAARQEILSKDEFKLDDNFCCVFT